MMIRSRVHSLTLRAIEVSRPHIYYRDGYWRVTQCPDSRHRSSEDLERWNKAHLWIARWNNTPAQWQRPVAICNQRMARLLAPWELQ